MDRIRTIHDELDSEETGLLSELRAADHAAERLSLLTIVVGVVLGLFGGLLAIMLFTRGIARRVGRNEENAKRLERGDPLLPPPDGLDEVGRSGRAFEIAAGMIADREAQLLDTTEQLRDLYNHSASGYHSLDRDGVYVLVNDTELGWLGYTREEVVGKKRLVDVLPRTSRERFLVEFPAFIERGSMSDVELELRRKDGTTMSISLSATAVVDDAGEFVMSRSTLIDVSERHSAEETAGHYRKQLERSNAELQETQDELRRLATVDELTGLYNLRGFIPLAEHQLRLCDRSGISAAILFMDLDGLKRVNDDFGHDEGSALLVEAVAAIRSVVRTSDVVARYGGDEFCALLTGGDESAEVVSRRLLEAIALRNASTTRPYDLAVSLGSAIYHPGDGVAVEELMRQADAMMYEQKTAKRAARVSS
jgi:diguanylate cyclase (GGDEF)-like protein/PAS domain S-box-containing protein